MSNPFNRPERETSVESYLRQQMLAIGGRCLKFNCTESGFPDRLCLFPNGKMLFIETKRPGGKLAPLQTYRQAELRALAVDAEVADTRPAVDRLIARWTFLA